MFAEDRLVWTAVAFKEVKGCYTEGLPDGRTAGALVSDHNSSVLRWGRRDSFWSRQIFVRGFPKRAALWFFDLRRKPMYIWKNCCVLSVRCTT